VTWSAGRDYLIESVNGWAGPYIANAYVLFGRADSYIWFIWSGIGCPVLLLVFEIIERNARRKKQRNGVATPKQRQVGDRLQTKKSRST